MSLSIESVLRRDRWLVAASLALVMVLAWAYILAGAGMGVSAFAMTRIPFEGMSIDVAAVMQPATWTAGYALLMFFMWWIMMVAMMLPSAAPTILLAAALNRKAQSNKSPFGAAGFFAAGYLLGWAAFSLVAVGAQWYLEASGACAMMGTDNRLLAGGLLLAAALWQLTPLKQACLRKCRSPVDFLTQRRRKGNRGALEMGMEHGVYCIGCCWLLMALLFVGGVMNLYWILALAVFVAMEKGLRLGPRIGLLAAAGLGSLGVGLLAGLV